VSRDAALLAIIAAVCLALNFATITRSPTIAEDEVAFTEPALNLSHGHGFMFPGWNEGRFWTGNAPLYPLLLSLWLRVVPFSIAGVRSLNILLALGAMLLIVAAVVRGGIVRSPPLLFAALLCGYSISFSYRGGRYDALCMLLFGLIAFASTVQSRASRHALIAVAAFCMPAAGLLLPACAGVVSVILLVAFRRSVLFDLIVFWIAMLAGIGALLLLYAHFEVLGDFLTLIGRHSLVHGASVERTSFNTLAGKWSQVPYALLVDKINLLMAIAVAWFAFRRRTRLRLAWVAVAIAILLPLAIGFLYMYRIYYGWMIAIPLLIALASLREESIGLDRKAATAILWLSILVGLPARATLSAVEWRSRSYAPVEALAARNVRAEDRVYADFSAYYAVRPRSARLWLPLQRFPPYVFHPPQEATLLILGPESKDDVHAFTGNWREVDRYTAEPSPLRRSFGAAPYDLRVYRRAG
jgi:hypothetical protein